MNPEQQSATAERGPALFTAFLEEADRLKNRICEQILAIQDRLAPGQILLFSPTPDAFFEKVVTSERFETFPYLTDHFYINQWDDEHTDAVFGLCSEGVICEKGYADTEIIHPDDIVEIHKLVLLLEYADKYAKPVTLPESVRPFLPQDIE